MQSIKQYCLLALFFLCTACTVGDPPWQGPDHTPRHTVVTLDYGGFRLRYDCTARTALRYEYRLTRDTANFPRPPDFTLAPAFPAGCQQQFTAKSYVSVRPGYDRGHLVTSNHMDYDRAYLLRANYMSNIVPQVSSFNQGIWVDAENVAECYRDIAPVDVYGGVVYGTAPGDTANDYYVHSHGIRTPEFFWKTVITTEPGTANVKAISWYIPNADNLAPLDTYIVSIDDLERLIGARNVDIRADFAVKRQRPAQTWPLPADCNFSMRPALAEHD